jgi:hypothetical protein
MREREDTFMTLANALSYMALVMLAVVGIVNILSVVVRAIVPEQVSGFGVLGAMPTRGERPDDYDLEGLAIEVPASASRDNRTVKIVFVDPVDVDELCGTDAVSCAMVGRDTIIAPNPCLFTAPEEFEWAFYDSEKYAAVLCHEIAHLNGWKHRGETDDE